MSSNGQRKRAILYVRVSSEKQREDGYSISYQLEKCDEYARRKNYVIVGDKVIDKEGYEVDASPGTPGTYVAYADVYTGSSLERPALLDMQDYMYRSGFDVIVVDEPSRWGAGRLRDTEFIILTDSFEQKGVTVEFVTRGGAYSDDFAGRATQATDAFVNTLIALDRVQRTTEKKLQKARDGSYVGGGFRPYGYRPDKSFVPGALAIIEEEAEVVRLIFNLFVVDNMAIREICRHLDGQGIPTPRNSGNGWAKSTVTGMLGNETYVGRSYYQKHIRRGKRLFKRPEDQWTPIKVSPIVDESLFNAAQVELEHNRAGQRTRSGKPPMLLQGRIVCERCGKAYYPDGRKADSRNRRKTPAKVYRHRKSAGHCTNRQISAYILEPPVWQFIEEVLLDRENLRAGYEEMLSQSQRLRNQHIERLEITEKTIKSLKDKLDVLIDKLGDGLISDDEFLRQRAKIDPQIERCEVEQEAVRLEIQQLGNPATLESLEAMSDEIREILCEEVPEEHKRKILDLLHVQVDIPPEGDYVIVSGWFKADGILPITPRWLARRAQARRCWRERCRVYCQK